MAAFRIHTADPGDTIQVITTGNKMFTNGYDSVKMELAILISVLIFIYIAKIRKMLFEDGMKDISAAGKIASGF